MTHARRDAGGESVLLKHDTINVYADLVIQNVTFI